MAETTKSKSRRVREGFFAKYIADPGIDIGCSTDPLNETFRRFDIMYGDGDAQRMEGIPDNTFATVYASHVLEHLHDPIEAIRNWFRILRDGGYLIIQVPHMELYEKRVDLPSRWNGDHKTYWLPEYANALVDPPAHVRGLLETVVIALPVGDTWEVEYCRVLDEGYSANGDEHPSGEYSIEICIRKGLPTTETKRSTKRSK
jgi:SAM-dependent methyltransferase